MNMGEQKGKRGGGAHLDFGVFSAFIISMAFWILLFAPLPGSFIH